MIVQGSFMLFLKERAKGSTFYGFKGGPAGIMKCKYVELNAEYIQPYRNQVLKLYNLWIFPTRLLIAELNEIPANEVVDESGLGKKKLTEQSLKLFDLLPEAIQEQLMLERDPHRNVQVAKIETEKMLIQIGEKKASWYIQGTIHGAVTFLRV